MTAPRRAGRLTIAVTVLGSGAIATGAALLPVNLLMLVVSPRAGRLSYRWGARWPMTIGALIAAAGTLELSGVGAGDHYARDVLPGLMLFGGGLSLLVAPLTAAVLAAVPEQAAGIASAVNNAAARLAGLLAVAALPLAAGIGGVQDLGSPAFAEGFRRLMWICAGLCTAAALVSFATVRRTAPIVRAPHPNVMHGCAQRRPLSSQGPRSRSSSREI